MKTKIVICLFILFISSSQITFADSELFVNPKVIDLLAKEELKKAATALRNQQPSDKSIYLLREINNIVLHDAHGYQPDRHDSYGFYKGLGTAYHNLFLFLKTKSIFQEEFTKKALKYYKRSRSFAGPLDKQEIDILIAALLAAQDQEKELTKAKNIIKKINLKKMKFDYQIQECLAAYYAAQKNIELTIKALRRAYLGRSKTVLYWIAVGDDFYAIEADPRFQALLKEWALDKEQNNIHLSQQPKAKPRLSITRHHRQ
ncbi:MAG: hypothetical protein ABH859_00960 [Pseudomonadota bacterium]